ncbi:MAG: DUF6498-containing protein [Candidatus Woesearchaeota archaeon]
MRLIPDFKSGLKDTSTIWLILSNVVAIILAVAQSWDIKTIIFMYWMQGMIIGFFTFIRMLYFARNVSENYPFLRFFNSILVGGNFKASIKDKNKIKEIFILWRLGQAAFFAVHYGLANFVYLVAITKSGLFGNSPITFGDYNLLIAVGGFFIAHLISFVVHFREDAGKSPESFTREAYRRITPMHLTMVLGGLLIKSFPQFTASSLLLILFLALRAYYDVKGHIEKHANASD